MRFITISAAVLIGSALSAAHAQQLSPSGGIPSGKVGAAEKLKKGFSGPGKHSNFVLGGSDSCATATPIAGSGPFAGDNIGATTDGPAACGAFANDVWYDWTNGAAGGSVTVTLCGGGTTYDSTLQIFDGPACVGPALACNDDFCGAQSQVSFVAVPFGVYKIRVGGFAGATGAYSMSISAPVPPPPGDSCGAPLVAVTGANPFDLTGNTTGPEGQAEGICLFFGSTNINSDEWYTWIASCTGTATVQLCGGATIDSKIAAYNGAGCPGGPAIACNDDSCGLQSSISFPCVAGTPYTIQLGTFPGAAVGAGTFTISCAAGIPPEDSCSTPAIAVTGVNPFNLAGNTTGPEGQAEAICLFSGSTGIDNDEWYTWVANCTGTATVDLCGGQSTIDSKVAVYDGSGCPTAAAIACNDDFCGLQSSVSFACTSGNAYTIQLGTFPGAGFGSGTFTITCSAPPPPSGPCDILHDGSTENSLGFNSTTADVLWLHSQGETGVTTVVKSIATAWGSLPFGGGPPNGTPARVGIWSDPNGDRNPNDAVLIQSVNTFVVGTNTDALQVVNLSPSVLVTGRYFIGASCQGATFQAPLDQSSGPGGTFVWVCGNPTGVLNYNSIGTAPFPPAQEDGFAPGRWLLQGDCKSIAITEMCGADGMNCPCGNNGAIGNGCASSANPMGAHLAGSGNSIISNDTVSIAASGVRKGNPTLALFFSGSEVTPNPVNDGLLCAGAPICRLWTWSIPGPGGGLITLTGPDASTIPPNVTISGRSAALGRPIMNSETRVYTVWYRDPANFACVSPAFSNYTNGLRILWSQ